MLRGKRSLSFNEIAGVEILRSVGLFPWWAESIKTIPVNSQASVVRQCWQILESKNELHESLWTTLVNLLRNFANATECSDPRDRIFGLLGLAQDTEELGIVADYSRQYHDVLHDVSVRIMSQQSYQGMLQPLREWEPANTDNKLGLPTWVSHWPFQGKIAHQWRHNATGQWTGTVDFSADRLCMQLQGIRIAYVLQDIPESVERLLDGLTYLDLERLESMITRAGSHLGKYHPNSSEIVITTILGGHKSQLMGTGSQVLEALRKLALMAKAELSSQPGNDKIKLLPLVKRLPMDEQQDAKTVLWESYLLGRSIYLVDGHRICLAPMHAQAGDIIAIFRGGHNLYVIRPHGEDFKYVGDAYMYGYMDAEVMEEEGWKSRIETFSLI